MLCVPVLSATLVCGLITAVSAPATPARRDAEPVRRTIAWDWPAEPVSYTLVRTTTDVIPVPGKDPVVARTIARWVSHRAVGDADAEGGGTPVRLTWDAIRFDENDSLNTPLAYDSRIEHHWIRTSHPMIGNVAAGLGQSITMEITADGAVTGVRDLEDYLRGIERNFTKWNLANETTYERLQRVYTPQALMRSAGGTYAFLPERALAVGESYEVVRPLTLEHVRALETVEKHTLVGIDDEDGTRVARFEITGTLRWPDPGGLKSELFNVSLDKAVVSGAWAFDLERGLVVSYVFEASFLSDIVRFDPRDRSSTEVSTDQKVSDRMTLVEPGAAGGPGSPAP